ncbi:MAG: hypothetical protein ACTIJ4_13555, partial [Halomonas sp.]|uniref:hypothetical protein n=1 Tax=Halomonas sp. TaxID=1486246 RepID=UPI003F8DA61A
IMARPAGFEPATLGFGGRSDACLVLFFASFKVRIIHINHNHTQILAKHTQAFHHQLMTIYDRLWHPLGTMRDFFVSGIQTDLTFGQPQKCAMMKKAAPRRNN